MSDLDLYTAELNRFCRDVSEKVSLFAAGQHHDEVVLVLDVVRETIANLLLLELECERVLRRE
jgi:hypothetical protein